MTNAEKSNIDDMSDHESDLIKHHEFPAFADYETYNSLPIAFGHSDVEKLMSQRAKHSRSTYDFIHYCLVSGLVLTLSYRPTRWRIPTLMPAPKGPKFFREMTESEYTLYDGLPRKFASQYFNDLASDFQCETSPFAVKIRSLFGHRKNS